MAVADLQLLINTLFYACIFICGFAISIPIGVINIDNGGNCMLYGEFERKGSDSKLHLQYSKILNCNFPIYFSVFGCIFYGLGLTIYNGYAVFKSSRDPTVATQMWVMPFILVNSVIAAIMLIVSCMISVGFDNVCASFKATTRRQCSVAENMDIIDVLTSDKYNTGPFNKLLHVAEVASWICLLIWIALVVSGIVRAVRNRTLRAQGRASTDPASSDKAKFGDVNPTA